MYSLSRVNLVGDILNLVFSQKLDVNVPEQVSIFPSVGGFIAFHCREHQS